MLLLQRLMRKFLKQNHIVTLFNSNTPIVSTLYLYLCTAGKLILLSIMHVNRCLNQLNSWSVKRVGILEMILRETSI